MSTRSKQRRSAGRIYETEPNIKQAHFPATKRTFRDKHPTWSAPAKYQQTITQMNPFHAIFHPDIENEDLEYDEEQHKSYITSPVGRKRRKVTPEALPTRKIQTRSLARSPAKAEPVSKGKASQLKVLPRLDQSRPSKDDTPATVMPPPRTPRSFRKREIPSSQSPADSPLSTQSRASVRSYARSPLKERSANRMLSTTTPRKVPHWIRKLEVADSMENDENESPITTPVDKTKYFEPTSPLSEDLASPGATQVPPALAVKSSILKQIPDSRSEGSRGSTDTSQSKADLILDSDAECDNEDDESKANTSWGMYSRYYRDQACSNLPDQRRPLSPTTTQATGIKAGYAATHDPDKWSSSSNLGDKSATIPVSHPDSDEASAQLANDLHRVSAPGGLQTESQYENAWVPYQPTNASNSDSDFMSSPANEAQDSTLMPAPMTVPTQILPPSTTPFRRAIPPSQATTIDITQPSPRKMPSSSSMALPSSPPPVPPPPSSSSPNAGGGAVDPWVGFEWNGARLTDSQLLPESLMNDSITGPPEISDLSQEDLRSE